MSGLGEILDENAALRRRLAAQREQLAAHDARLVAQQQQLVEKDGEIEKLKATLEGRKQVMELLEKKLLFIEKRRELAQAERFVATKNQEVLFKGSDFQLPPRDPAVAAKDEDAKGDGRRRSRAKGGHPRKGRRKLEDVDLDKARVTVPAGDVPGGEVVSTSSTTSWRVEYKPSKLLLVEVVREQKTRADGTVWTAPEPFLLPRAMCGDGLLAHVACEKFADHLPLNRQAKRLARRGLSFGTNVLSGWLRQGFQQLGPLLRALALQVVEEQLVLSDDTGHPVQDKGDGTLRKGRLWVFTDQRQAFYTFSPDKKGTRPTGILEDLGFHGGTLVADGGSEYDPAETKLGLVRGGCWSHFRRYFTNAAVLHDEAKAVLPTFHDLFMLEREWTELDPDERRVQRLTRSAPLVEGIYTFIEELGPKVRPSTLLAQACGYGLSQKSRMQLFLENGRVPLHNNLSELLLRQAVVGRKNWMFSRSSVGAEASAGWYSLIASAKLQGLDPGAYLYDVFKRLPSHPSNRIGELTPLNWRLAVEAGTLDPIEWGGFLG